MRSPEFWDRWFLGLAKYIATASKDPSTQTGAVIVDPLRRVVSVGYNGFPKRIDDRNDRLTNREMKYKMVVHCEVNAILFANRPLQGCVLYTWPFGSCAPCTSIVLQTGMTRVVAPVAPPEILERWGDDLALSSTLFREAGVIQTIVKNFS